MSPERKPPEDRIGPIGISEKQREQLLLFPIPVADPRESGRLFVAEPGLVKEFKVLLKQNRHAFEQLLRRFLVYLERGMCPPNIRPLRSVSGMVEFRSGSLRAYGAEGAAPGRFLVIFGLHRINAGDKDSLQDAEIARAGDHWHKWKQRTGRA